jgi:hypothetical protein
MDNTQASVIKIGAQVRHKDGTLGHVVGIQTSKDGERLIEWKTCGKWRVSGECVLTIAEKRDFRWRRS